MDVNTLEKPAAADHAPGRDDNGRWERIIAPLRRHVVFYAAAALIALHVVDDNYLQPAAGTPASDHLASGLLPLALLGLGAWPYPRVRAGAAAVVAMAIGAFGLIVGAIEAPYYASSVGASGDDYTGFVAAAAGLTLVGLSLVRLWTSRRQTPRLWWRYLRRVLIAVVSVVVAYQTVFPIGLAYLTTHVARAEVPAPHLGASYEDVTLHTSDGLTLHGWYVPSRNGAAVIAFPGRKGTQEQTRMLVAHGYGVLLFDRRGEGISDGDGNMFGWGGDRDIYAALDYLETRPDVDPNRIGGIGLSVGGELMLQAAANDDRLAAVVSEGAGTRSLAEEVEEYDTGQLATAFPFLVLKTAAVSVFSNHTPPPRLTDLVPEIAPRPLLLIWTPTSGVETMNPEYQRLGGPNATVWKIPEAQHIRGIVTRPQEYEDRVVGFFDDALRSDEGS